MSQNMSTSEFSILQQSIMSLGNNSFNQSGELMQNPYNMQGMGLSPSMLAQPIYGSSEGRSNMDNNNGNSRNDNGRIGNLSQVVPPPQVHQNELQQQQQRKEQEQQLQQLRYLQQQKLQQEHQQQQQRNSSRQNHFTPQEQQEILRNATSVMGNDLQRQQQQQPKTMHMDQLRINRLKEKRKMLEQQILHQRQLEILELKKLQNQQRSNDFQQNDQSQSSQQQQSSSEMRGALQNRLGQVYAGTEAFLEPTPITGGNQNQMSPPASLSNGDVTAELSGGSDSPLKDRRSGLVRENSLKMESIFENSGGNGAGGGGGGTTERSNPKRNFNNSTSGMSMSATSLSLGFEEESELSALFDTSMKIEGGIARGYATTLNDRGDRSPKPMKGRSTNASGNPLMGNTALLGMSLASMNKSNSSMSCDSSLSRLFDDGTPNK